MVFEADLPLSPAEVQAVMGINAGWPFPGNEDGWVKAHNAIRLDLADLSGSVSACVRQLKEGNNLEPWIIQNIQTWFPKFHDHIHEHHENEELILVPGLVAHGVEIPPRMLDDHPILDAHMEKVSAIVKGLQPGRTAAEDLSEFTALSQAVETLKADTLTHLKEEEYVCLPLLRHGMTRKQFQPILNKILAKATPELLGWLLRAMPNDAERRRWMSDVAGIPSLIQSLVMLPATRKYTQNWARLLLDIKAGKVTPPEPKCGCF